MKIFFLITFICCFSINASTQNFEVHYLVKSPIQIPLGDNKTKELILNYEGFVFKSDSNAISFIKPLYLLDYPTGEISIKTGESSYYIATLEMDTIQYINLYNLTRLQHWHYNNSTPQYFTRNYKVGGMRWKLLPETKEINGLQCKHAVSYNGGDTTKAILYDIWYYPNIEMGVGLWNLTDAPGLVVECNYALFNMTYTLKYFKKDEPINNAVFWPAVFNKVKFVDYTKPQKVSEADKKKEKIMNQ